MRVPEIQPQTGLTKKLVFCASFHRVLIKVWPPAGDEVGIMYNLQIIWKVSDFSFDTLIPLWYFLLDAGLPRSHTIL
jgi:hypothetical protein